MRASTSDGPPAGKGTTILIERLGKLSGRSCAAAAEINCTDKNASAMARRFIGFTTFFSIETDTGVLDHMGPAIRLLADECGEFLRRAGHGIIARPLGFLLHGRIGQSLHDLGV